MSAASVGVPRFVGRSRASRPTDSVVRVPVAPPSSYSAPDPADVRNAMRSPTVVRGRTDRERMSPGQRTSHRSDRFSYRPTSADVPVDLSVASRHVASGRPDKRAPTSLRLPHTFGPTQILIRLPESSLR
jgi:hypothetical protein